MHHMGMTKIENKASAPDATTTERNPLPDVDEIKCCSSISSFQAKLGIVDVPVL